MKEMDLWSLERPTELRCEYMQNPLGIDEPQPRLEWLVNAGPNARGVKQTAYQILVASAGELLEKDEADVWDSGKVDSSQSTQVTYAGPELLPRQRYWWKVRTWCSGNMRPSPWSEPAWWEMGLLEPTLWQGEWIGAGMVSSEESAPCAHLRTSFHVGKPVSRARVYVTALGIYELWMNGQRVGADLFTPGWTDYAIRVQYQTYDVTAQLHQGENVVGAILGDGWYCGYLAWANKKNLYGAQPQLLVHLEIDYVDGTYQTVVTDDSWLWSTGPILYSDIYNGEYYDARLELPGWCEPGYNAEDWRPVRSFGRPQAILNASASPRVRRMQELTPVKVSELASGAVIYDMGQNMVGWARLRIRGKAGAKITLRFAEVLNPDGALYTENLRSAKCTDTYVSRGGAEEIYEPRFTFHGFRYVEVTGYAGRLDESNITGIVIHSDTAPTGSFSCSNAMLNQLQHNIVWGQKGNFLEVPTDCPQRDERLGWTGDAQVFIRTACFNMDVAGFFTKWLRDLNDAQSPAGAYPSVAPDVLHKRAGDGGPAWADAGIICPFTLYLCYGDKRILRRYYPQMRRYIAYLRQVDPTRRHCFGDWLNVDDPTPKDLIAVAFRAYCLQLMATIADVLGQEQDAAQYLDELKEVKTAFRNEFVTPNGRLVSASQTGYVLALHFDLLQHQVRSQALERLVQRIHERNDHLSTGFVGTPYLLSVLSDYGHIDLAYKLLLNEDYPSWGYPISQGATTMWERWDGYRHDKGFQTPKMNSFNHYAYGAVGDWMYRHVAGLDTSAQQPGYRRITIRPRPGGGITWAKAELRTAYGYAKVHWQIADDQFVLTVTVPHNAEATIILPTNDGAEILESGLPLTQAYGIELCDALDETVTCNVGSGRYHFSFPWRA
ncbi:MAG: family 78 glycoside hydrolase catalytic domain [Limnochordia bacterium]|jgi:alpha-L-rhamnosidase